MSPFERCEGLPNQLIGTDQLNLVLVYRFNRTGFAKKRVASLKRTKLALS